MLRREFVGRLSAGSVGCLLLSSCSYKADAQTDIDFQRTVLDFLDPARLGLPPGNRIPFGWEAIPLLPEQKSKFTLKTPLPEGKTIFLRVSVAQEIWEEKLISVDIPQVNMHLGDIDVRYSSVLVPYEIEIQPEQVKALNEYGGTMTLVKGAEPIWIFSQKADNFDNTTFLPHLLTSSSPQGNIQDFLNCFLSVDSIQAFGWREGCVLDGLWQIYHHKQNEKALETIKKHFALYFPEDKGLVYETSRSKPNDNRIDGIESTIPFATLVRLQPDHPVLKEVIKAWETYTKENGMITDGLMISAEGCYTVAYPMAIMGKTWKDQDLKHNAIAQLKHRFVLLEADQFYLRSEEGRKTYKNWARGAAWFLLGFARTIAELKNDLDDQEVIDKFKHGVDLAISMQRNDGLWSCFMHKDVLADTSGSAGISAAIMIGIHHGILPASYARFAKKCWSSLQNYLSPDGYLRGVAQDNRGGIQLQESDYRVIAQMGMGMMGQLYAYL